MLQKYQLAKVIFAATLAHQGFKTLLFSVALTLLILLQPEAVSGQSQRKNYSNFNGWYMLYSDIRLHPQDRWFVQADAQWRRADWIKNAQQAHYRISLNLAASNRISAGAGYGFFYTYRYGKLPFAAEYPENRFFEQLLIRDKIGSADLLHRYRLEQRFVHTPVLKPDSSYSTEKAVYTNRFRYMLRVSVPLKGKEIRDGSVYISAYDEVFINFGNRVQYNVFDQNRAYLALGYRMKGGHRLELGYMQQLMNRSNGKQTETNWTLQLSLTGTLHLNKE